jgi:sugar phosphate isomerase/epimerase
MGLTRREWMSALALAAAPRRFAWPPGLQLYSLRRAAARDLPGTLDLVRQLGIRDLEAGDLHGRSTAEWAKLLGARELRVSCYGASWEALARSTEQTAETARALGASFVMCSAIPGKTLTADATARAAASFNRWGEQLKQAGLRFCYHPHGPEFASAGSGNWFDQLVRAMDPRYANFEMDIMWFQLGGVDPARALDELPGRFPLLHLKDPRKGEPKTFDPGPVEEEASVPIGTGQVDWPAVLRAAARQGVEHYYIEEEHPNAVPQIRRSLEYLRRLTL